MAFKIGPYTVTRGALIPYDEECATSQAVDEAEDDSVVVTDSPNLFVRYITASIHVARTEAKDIMDFLTYGVGFRRDTFQLVDGYGTTWTVRYWDAKVKASSAPGSKARMKLRFRVEVN